ncbi:HIT family protein [Candidatus Phytoplasma meliae]|uniref:HIT family protein n=1 Tax=Candidatus Phytoplasma meliae TaxID=1848402 RepID=A0ABS5CYY8_9MOLU|nr:HIT family protein [Candidatus Phytoplasma meliae]MBP5835802.1 HIT family protein [Candidatus Phytoplasma meliae]MBP5836187.1 HIT family protein [Candidatus Phytoplasma meliae]
MSTIFTKIIQKQIPSYVIYEDDLVIAFLDVTQFTKGHTLVITKKEYQNIADVPEAIFTHLFKIVHKISKVLINSFHAQGINLLNNNGEIAGQTVFHYHVHLIPRFDKNEVKIKTSNNMNSLTASDYENIQNTILKNWHKR